MPVNPIGRTERVVDDQDRATEKLSLFTEEVARLIAANEAALAVLNYRSETVELGGAFGSQTVKCVRVGDTVTISSQGALSHSSMASAASASGAIPAAFRPAAAIANVYTFFGAFLGRVEISSGGTLTSNYRDYSGTIFAKTDTGGPVLISYNV